MNNYDVIIVGAGPSGISCAVYLKRFNYNVLVIKKDYGALEKATIDNYYGFNSISGKELFDIGVNQALSLGIDVVDEEVVSIENFNDFCVKTNLFTYTSKSLYLATGKQRKKVDILNLEKYEGKGISYCAICDGFFYKKKKIAIIGSGNFMKSELEILKNFSSDIIVFTNGENLEVETDCLVVTDKIVSFDGDTNLNMITTTNNTYQIDGTFIAIGSASASDFASHMGLLLDSKKNIVIDDNFMTNIKGMFAGGDVTGGLLQVSKAVSDGALASIGIKNYLKSIS